MKPVSELRQYYEILRRHVTIVGLVAAIAVVGVSLELASQGRLYQAEVSLLVTPQALGASSDGKPDLAAFQTQYRTFVINDILYLAKSGEVLHRVAERVGAVPGQDLPRAVTVRSLPETDILLIAARDTDRTRAALIANTITQELVQYYQELNRAAAASTRVFIADQVNLTRKKLLGAEEALVAFRSRTNIINLSDSTSRMIQRSFELRAMDNAALLDEKAAQTRVNAIKQRLRSENDRQLASVEIATNPVVAQLRDRLVAAEAELAGLRQIYTDQHPKVQEALGRVADLRSSVRQEGAKAIANQSLGVSPIREQLARELVSGEVDGTVARARADAISPLLGQMEAELSKIPSNELALARLQRDVKVNEDVFMRLSSLYQDALIREQSAGVSGQAALVIVDEIAAAPVATQLPLKAGLAGLLGLILGCVLALLVDNMDNRVRSPREAEGAYGVPVLASVPTMSHQNHRSLMGEPGFASLIFPFLLPFLFVFAGLLGLLLGIMHGRVAAELMGALMSQAGPVVGSVAGQVGAVCGEVSAAVVRILHLSLVG